MTIDTLKYNLRKNICYHSLIGLLSDDEQDSNDVFE